MLSERNVEIQTKGMSNEEIFDIYLTEKNDIYLNQIVKNNLDTIHHLAIKFHKGLKSKVSIDKDDLAHCGIIGYKLGLLRYSNTMNTKVNSFCYFWVSKEIQAFIYNEASLVRYPRNIMELAADYKKNLREGLRSQTIARVLSCRESIQNVDDYEHSLKEESDAISGDMWVYLDFILSGIDEEEKTVLMSIIEDGVFHKDIPEVKKVKKIYSEFKKQLLFVPSLIKNKKCIMDKKTYEKWQKGMCGTLENFYPSKKLFDLERERLDFSVTLTDSGDVLLQLN